MQKGECVSCVFYAKENDNFGTCHRNPPRITDDTMTEGWPEVKKTDWCGEYRKDEIRPRVAAIRSKRGARGLEQP